MITCSKQVGRQIQSMTMCQAAWLRGTRSAPARVTRATPLAAKEEDRSDIGCVFQHVSQNIIGALRGQRSAECRLRVIRVALIVRRSLPVYPCQQTFSVLVGMSQRCQQLTHAVQQTASLSITSRLRGAILSGRVWTSNPSPTRLHRFRRRASILPSRALASPRWRHSNRTHGLPPEAPLLGNEMLHYLQLS
jgi:hypothetical protein